MDERKRTGKLTFEKCALVEMAMITNLNSFEYFVFISILQYQTNNPN